MMRAPLRRPRRVPKSGASMRKPRTPNKLPLPSIGSRTYENITARSLATPQFPGRIGQKKDSGSARKEKQQIPNKRAATRIALTCYFGQQAAGGVRIFFEKMRVKWRPEGRPALALNWRRPALRPWTLQAELRLLPRARAGGLLADFLEERLELAFFQGGDERGIGRLNAKIVDWHGQLHIAIELDHFAVLQDLLTSREQLLARALAFHLVDPGEQRFQVAMFAHKRSRGLSTDARAGNVIDRISGDGEHIADQFRRDIPLCC